MAVVYLMERNGQFRIGKARSTERARGRASQEDASRLWILVENLIDERAKLVELYLQTRFGIPGVVFHADGAGKGIVSNLALLEQFWRGVGNNERRAYRCLKLFGLSLDTADWSRMLLYDKMRDRTRAARLQKIKLGERRINAMLAW